MLSLSKRSARPYFFYCEDENQYRLFIYRINIYIGILYYTTKDILYDKGGGSKKRLYSIDIILPQNVTGLLYLTKYLMTIILISIIIFNNTEKKNFF